MRDFMDYQNATIDELSQELFDSKQRIKAIEKLIEVRRLFGEKTQKQIEAQKAKEKNAQKPNLHEREKPSIVGVNDNDNDSSLAGVEGR